MFRQFLIFRNKSRWFLINLDNSCLIIWLWVKFCLKVPFNFYNLTDLATSWLDFLGCIANISQVEVPDRKSICPDRPRRNMSMSRPSQTESAYVQTFVRSKFFVRSSCVQNSLCPDFRAFKILYDQTLVRSKLKFVRSFVRSKTPMSRLSCVQTCLCPDFCAFKILYDQNLVRSKWKIVRSFVRSCPDYRAFKNIYVQTFVRSKMRMSRLSCVHVQITFL